MSFMADNIIYGIHTISAQICYNFQDIVCIYIGNKFHNNVRLSKLIENAKSKNINIKIISNVNLLSILASYGYKHHIIHQNIVAICSNNIKIYYEQDILMLLKLNSNKLKPIFILILDHIQDPHNMGACIRTAEAVGVDFIIFAKNNTVSYMSAAVNKVSCGAIYTVKLVCVTNIMRVLKLLKKEGVWILGLSSSANDNLYDIDLTVSIALIVGNENKGLRFIISKACDYLTKIPIISNNIKCLNASVAASIGMYEIYRQRNFI